VVKIFTTPFLFFIFYTYTWFTGKRNGKYEYPLTIRIFVELRPYIMFSFVGTIVTIWINTELVFYFIVIYLTKQVPFMRNIIFKGRLKSL